MKRIYQREEISAKKRRKLKDKRQNQLRHQIKRRKCFKSFKLKELSIYDDITVAHPNDLYFTIIDEISLEGLDGITLEGILLNLLKYCFITNYFF